MSKMDLIQVARENFKIAKDNYYVTSKGSIVELREAIEDMINNTEILENIDLKEDEELKIEGNKQSNYVVSDNIINIGTIDCILKFREEGITGNIIALNFASAINPGGGYLIGSRAQEESLCRASMLYENLIKQKSFYKYNRENYTPLYNDRMIYVPNVPVIRNDKLQLLESLELASFIVSPAVNKRKAYAEGIRDDELINKTMDVRIEKILTLAVSKKPSVIILGAYGCGVFGNDREVIYSLFERHIRRIVPEGIRVAFAVI